MVLGWRRAFCTSISKEKENRAFPEKKQLHSDSTSQRHRLNTKFGFFSKPLSPRLRTQPVSTPSLRCRTTKATATSMTSVPSSPQVQCSNNTTLKKANSLRLFEFSSPTPSSPKSPSSFSFLKTSIRLSKSTCGICMQSVKSGQGTALFTAECSHLFHFPCIAAHVKKHQILMCPVCSTSWNQLPLLTVHGDNQFNPRSQVAQNSRGSNSFRIGDRKTKSFRIYDDDEPLMSPTSAARFFNPIPESDETEEEQETDQDHKSTVEFLGFSNSSSPRKPPYVKSIELRILPEAAIVAVDKSYETYVAILKVKALSSSTMNRSGRVKRNPASRRVPMDLVTVLDVGGSMTGPKLQTMKRSMRLVISSLGPTDRLSIVAFSSTTKRVLPLRRMNSNGQRSARRIVDALVAIHQNQEAHVKNEALKKAAKVLEDRREKNPVARIMLLIDGRDECAAAKNTSNQKNSISSLVHANISFGHFEIPVHKVGITDHEPSDSDDIAKCVGNLLSVAIQELKFELGVVSRTVPAEIAAVYAVSGRLSAVESGLVGLGDLHAEEERELLVELRLPEGSSVGSQHVLTVRSSYRDPSTQELVHSEEQPLLLPRPQTVTSVGPEIEEIRTVHVACRAVAESRRLLEHNDVSGAHHWLSSSRALLMRSDAVSAEENLRWLESKLVEVQRMRQQEAHMQSRRQNGRNWRQRESGRVEEKAEPLTPTSAWRAAERLAKVAITRKSMNRVSDLHGFENAMF